MSNDRFTRYLRDVLASDVAADPAVLAARDRVAAVEERHRALVARLQPLRDSATGIPPRLAEARDALDQGERRRGALAVDVAIGVVPESDWCDHEGELDCLRDLICRLELAEAGLAERLRDGQRPLNRSANDAAEAVLALDAAIERARRELAIERMNA